MKDDTLEVIFGIGAVLMAIAGAAVVALAWWL